LHKGHIGIVSAAAESAAIDLQTRTGASDNGFRREGCNLLGVQRGIPGKQGNENQGESEEW
jgi:hypothetical protein